MKTVSLVLVALPFVLLWPLAAAASGEGEKSPPGKETYRVYCASCHGLAGRGDGPVATEMLVRPTDLTRLADTNGGEFPADDVAAAIDGRRDLRGHGSSSMPVWGLSFQEASKVANQEAEVAARIEQLVAYLRTLQR